MSSGKGVLDVGVKMIEGQTRAKPSPDVMWHLAGEPPGGQAVRRTDSQLCTSQVMLLGGGRSRRRRSLAGWSLSEPHSQLSFSVTHWGRTGGGKKEAQTSQICTHFRKRKWCEMVLVVSEGKKRRASH